MAEEEQGRRRAERRNDVSSIFVGMLVALAYAEAIPPVREAVRAGRTSATLALFGVFFLVSLRFFIGAHLHLISRELAGLPGAVWFYDFCWIVAETVVLVFMGGVASVEASRQARLGLAELLLLLYAMDVAWIGSQWVLGRLLRGWRRPVPWAWAALNAALGVAILAPGLIRGDLYAGPMVAWLGVTNLAGFVVDVLLVDHYDLL